MEVSSHVRAAVERVEASTADALQRAEALVEVAMDLQKQPRKVQDLLDALFLYDEALRLTEDHPLPRARALAGRGAALRRMPGSGPEELAGAREHFEQALPVLREHGDAEETAEIEMAHGLVLQGLAAAGRAKLPDAIAAYQRALRVFTREAYPREFAILHNNLATAYLSMRMSPEKEGMREALAVQSFMEALKVVTLEEDPSEYAMLQNNLGNALQAVRSKNRMANLERAVEAYDEALKVRTAWDTPVEYANTITNKANALMNLPDDAGAPERGNPNNLRGAIELLRSAADVFAQNHVPDRAQIVLSLATELEAELKAGNGASATQGAGAE